MRAAICFDKMNLACFQHRWDAFSKFFTIRSLFVRGLCRHALYDKGGVALPYAVDLCGHALAAWGHGNMHSR